MRETEGEAWKSLMIQRLMIQEIVASEGARLIESEYGGQRDLIIENYLGAQLAGQRK